MSYERPHLWADPDETLQGNPGALLATWGVGCGTIPMGPRGVGSQFKKAVEEVANLELFCFLCHRTDNNFAYTFAAGCIQKC